LNQHDATLVASIVQQLASDLFNKPVMSNLTRPLYVERLVTHLLGPRWTFVGGEWTDWDIQRDDAVRVEVKQSAARQMWSDRPSRSGKPTLPIFDIKERSGYYADGGTRWVATRGRPAELYVFAWHPRYAPKESVDHRDPAQWQLYVLLASALPPTKSITLSTLKKLGACEADHATLAASVEQQLRGTHERREAPHRTRCP
jgi:hypothetical protein